MQAKKAEEAGHTVRSSIVGAGRDVMAMHRDGTHMRMFLMVTRLDQESGKAAECLFLGVLTHVVHGESSPASSLLSLPKGKGRLTHAGAFSAAPMKPFRRSNGVFCAIALCWGQSGNLCCMRGEGLFANAHQQERLFSPAWGGRATCNPRSRTSILGAFHKG